MVNQCKRQVLVGCAVLLRRNSNIVLFLATIYLSLEVVLSVLALEVHDQSHFLGFRHQIECAQPGVASKNGPLFLKNRDLGYIMSRDAYSTRLELQRQATDMSDGAMFGETNFLERCYSITSEADESLMCSRHSQVADPYPENILSLR